MNTRRIPRVSIKFLVFVTLVVLSTSRPAAGEPVTNLDTPPKGFHSRITGAQAPIEDDDFAKMMKDLLVKDGKSTVLDAKFLFQSCYAGGMLSSLKNELGDMVKWVGGSASKFNQFAYGQRTKAENEQEKPKSDLLVADRPHGFWTVQLLNQLKSKPDQSLLDAINEAAKADEFGSAKNDPKVKQFLEGPGKLGDVPGMLETGQSIVGGKGEEIKLKDGKSHHAIFWVGRPGSGPFGVPRQRNSNDVEDLRAELVKAWGDPQKNPDTVSITIHYGRGKDDPAVPKAWKDMGWDIRPATDTDLAQTVGEIKKKLGPDEEFFFYAGDHGEMRQEMLDQPKGMGVGLTDSEALLLDPGVVWGMLADPDNLPTMTVQYVDLSQPVPVYFNDFLLGELLPGSSSQEFMVPEEILDLNNEVKIVNTSAFDFTVISKSFSSDAVGEFDVNVLMCDVDGNGVIDRNDISAIFAARNTPATAMGDPRDVDGDGIITVNDARVCANRCTNTLCAP